MNVPAGRTGTMISIDAILRDAKTSLRGGPRDAGGFLGFDIVPIIPCEREKSFSGMLPSRYSFSYGVEWLRLKPLNGNGMAGMLSHNGLIPLYQLTVYYCVEGILEATVRPGTRLSSLRLQCCDGCSLTK